MSVRKFAQGTEVSVEKSRAEIESMLARYGASKFGYMADDTRAHIAFQANRRHIRFILALPASDKFRKDGRGSLRTAEGIRVAREKECRRLWRALALVIKAKLEAVSAKISVFEDEFLANIVMPDGRTVSEHTRPSIEAAYQGNDVPLLPDYRGQP
jgi:hypothetical protein